MRCDACVWNAKRRVLNLLTRYDTRQKHIDLLRTACPAAPTTSELRRPHQRHERSSPPRRACISCSALVDVAAGPSPDVENPTSGGDLGPSGSTLGPPSGAQNAIGKWRTVQLLKQRARAHIGLPLVGAPSDFPTPSRRDPRQVLPALCQSWCEPFEKARTTLPRQRGHCRPLPMTRTSLEPSGTTSSTANFSEV